MNRARFLFEITETILEHVEPGRVGIKIGPMNIPRFNTRLQATRWKQDQFIEDLGAFRRQCRHSARHGVRDKKAERLQTRAPVAHGSKYRLLGKSTGATGRRRHVPAFPAPLSRTPLRECRDDSRTPDIASLFFADFRSFSRFEARDGANPNPSAFLAAEHHHRPTIAPFRRPGQLHEVKVFGIAPSTLPTPFTPISAKGSQRAKSDFRKGLLTSMFSWISVVTEFNPRPCA